MGGRIMSPEVEAAIIKTAGKWTIELAKGYRIKRSNIEKFLSQSFKWSYDTISSTIANK
jgi:hypothetical protein